MPFTLTQGEAILDRAVEEVRIVHCQIVGFSDNSADIRRRSSFPGSGATAGPETTHCQRRVFAPGLCMDAWCVC